MADPGSALPPLYRAWVEPLVGPVVGEPRSTCDHCVMLRRFDEEPIDIAFDAQTKCCTFFPELPNFNVGRALADEDPIGAGARSVLRARIKERIGVSPLGIDAPVLYRTIYDNATAAFGMVPAMRCPYYVDEGGLCGVWRHRNAVCSTWFCKSEKGGVGKIYWKVVLTLLQLVETSVKLWALGAVGLDEEARVDMWNRVDWEKRTPRPQLDVATLNGAPRLDRYKKDWANFFGREEELYRLCAEAAEKLGPDDILRLGGVMTSGAVEATRLVLAKISSLELPDRVVGGSNTYLQIRKGGQVRIHHNAIPYDWLDIPEALAREAYRFKTGPVPEVLATLRSEGVPVDEELVRRLLEWQVLVRA